MNNNYIITKDGELYHYGVPGMKWGVRKADRYRARATVARKKAEELDEVADTSGSKIESLYLKRMAAKNRRKADDLDIKARKEELMTTGDRVKRGAKIVAGAAGITAAACVLPTAISLGRLIVTVAVHFSPLALLFDPD